jgi:nucleoside-diphosphate-sugar epimerase
MKCALVTGVTGFLGSRLAAGLLERGVDVIGLKRSASDLGQLSYAKALERLELHDVPTEGVFDLGAVLKDRQVDALFHTASLARVGSSEAENIALVDTNVRFPSAIIGQAKKSGLVKSFVNISTSWQSIDGKTYSPFNVYAATKEAFEHVVGALADATFPCVSLRLFDPYGAGDYRNKIVDLLVKTALLGKHLEMSPGLQKIWLVHVGDAVAGVIQAAQLALEGKGEGHAVYSIPGFGEPVSLRELADRIQALTGKEVSVAWGAREYRAKEVMLPSLSHPPVPGWSPAISLSDGLKEIVEMYRKVA